MCTAIRFSDKQENLYFGRNLDWSNTYGEHILVTPTGYRPQSPFGAFASIKHAVIGMGIIQENVPLYFDCANDAGLAIAGLNFPGYAQYAEEPLEGKINIPAYEFPFWIASQFKTVEQVKDALQSCAIVDKPINQQFPSSMLHWMISDAIESLVVEYTAQGMQIYQDNFGVLANQPEFPWHAENLRNYLNVSPEVPAPMVWSEATLSAYGSGGGMRGLPGDYYSPSRFVRAAYLNAHYPQQNSEAQNVLRLFHTLQGVAMIDGAARMANGEFEKTIYTSGFSGRSATYYYFSYEDLTVRSVSLSDYNTSGAELITASFSSRSS